MAITRSVPSSERPERDDGLHLDFWRLSGPPYTDLRVFGYAFYLQFLTLVTMIAIGSWTAITVGRSRKRVSQPLSF